MNYTNFNILNIINTKSSDGSYLIVYNEFL